MGRPTVCNDGPTIAKELELEDHEENLGAQVIRQAAEIGETVADALQKISTEGTPTTVEEAPCTSSPIPRR